MVCAVLHRRQDYLDRKYCTFGCANNRSAVKSRNVLFHACIDHPVCVCLSICLCLSVCFSCRFCVFVCLVACIYLSISPIHVASSFSTSVSNAPTSFVFQVEMSKDIDLTVPILVAIFVAKVVADIVSHPLYFYQLRGKMLPYIQPEPEVSVHGEL